MVNLIPANKPFYPTDHCGVIRIKTDDVLPQILCGLLEIEGKKQRFTRSLRASTDRIKSLTITVPPKEIQEKIVIQILKYEDLIDECKKKMSLAQSKKELILKKYLY